MISRLRKEVQVAAGPVAVVTVAPAELLVELAPVELARVEVAPVAAVQVGVATAALVEAPLQSAAAGPAPVDVARAQ